MSLSSVEESNFLYYGIGINNIGAAAGPAISWRATELQVTYRKDHLKKTSLPHKGKCESVMWLITPQAEVVLLLLSLQVRARERLLGAGMLWN